MLSLKSFGRIYARNYWNYIRTTENTQLFLMPVYTFEYRSYPELGVKLFHSVQSISVNQYRPEQDSKREQLYSTEVT